MMYVHGQRFNNHSGISGRLHHVEWCFHHYGFNDWGGRVTRAMLDATEENLEDVLREKDDAIRIVREMCGLLDSAESRMPVGPFRDLQRMLEGMLGLALLWKEYARSFFLFGMLRRKWSEEKAKRLETACEMMSRIAEGLPDNSDLTRVMWRGAQSPSLTSNIRESVESLIADYQEFLARKGDAAQ